MSDSQVALITGGRRGIGFGIARALAQQGWNIAIGDVAQAGEVTDAVAELEAIGAEVLYCKADVTAAADRARMINAIRQRFGKLNLLVNNAGVAPKVRADILDLEASEESFDRLIGINLKGPYFLTQLAARWMVEQKQADESFVGYIVKISSMSATVASTSRGDYCISKAGISMATMLWAARLAEFGINVYEIRPGIVATDMTAAVTAKYDKLIFEDGITPIRRWGQPEDIGKAVAAIAGGALPYSTGEVINIDGGFHIQQL